MTTNQSPKFAPVATGKYSVAVTTASGKAFKIFVKTIDAGNASARGGAYKPEWVAYNGALVVKVHAETRKAAYAAAVAALAARRITITAA